MDYGGIYYCARVTGHLDILVKYDCEASSNNYSSALISVRTKPYSIKITEQFEMRKILRERAAQQVTNQLISAEAALDEALYLAAKLICTSIEARIDAKLPLHCGQQAVKGMSGVIGHLTQARDELIAVHSELVETRILIGLGAAAYGDLGGCPEISADSKSSVVVLAG